MGTEQESGILGSHPSFKPGDEIGKGVAFLPPTERICDSDADAEPAQADVDHLCQVWAEVGRAILLRRKQRR